MYQKYPHKGTVKVSKLPKGVTTQKQRETWVRALVPEASDRCDADGSPAEEAENIGKLSHNLAVGVDGGGCAREVERVEGVEGESESAGGMRAARA